MPKVAQPAPTLLKFNSRNGKGLWVLISTFSNLDRITGKIAKMVEQAPSNGKVLCWNPGKGGLFFNREKHILHWIPDRIRTTMLKRAYEIHFNYMVIMYVCMYVCMYVFITQMS